MPNKEQIMEVIEKELDFFLKDKTEATLSDFGYYLYIMHKVLKVKKDSFFGVSPITLTNEEASSLIKTLGK